MEAMQFMMNDPGIMAGSIIGQAKRLLSAEDTPKTLYYKFQKSGSEHATPEKLADLYKFIVENWKGIKG
jgi:hypothetical protein